MRECLLGAWLAVDDRHDLLGARRSLERVAGDLPVISHAFILFGVGLAGREGGLKPETWILTFRISKTPKYCLKIRQKI